MAIQLSLRRPGGVGSALPDAWLPRGARRLAAGTPIRQRQLCGLVGGRYIPQGYGHSIEDVGSGPARILIGFNAGIYETIDLSQWIAANPKDVLATNFGQPAEVFGKFPDRDVFIAGKDGAR